MRNEPERLSGDEIDLYEIFERLWRQKLLIVATTVVFAGAALAYALLATPIYEAKIIVQPPTQNDIAQLNYGRGGSSGLSMLSVKDVYDVYLRNLQSESLRREFFQTVFLPGLPEVERRGSQDDLYGRFQYSLALGLVSKDSPGRYYVKADLPDPRRAADWVVKYVELAGRRGKDEIVQDIRSDAMVKANNLEQEITAARESARKQREDQIIQLSEALRVAQSIGLERPPIISNGLSGEVSAGMDGSLVYMRGTKALEAEIENLRKRTSDDPFVRDLRQRQEAVAFYRNLQINVGSVQVYRQDGAIESPDRPVKPRKLIILLMGVVVGAALGVLLALLRGFAPRGGSARRY
ncbi:Wzz/FepE/Etk N-terminal domain-containing protein [Pseudomonas entomophila]|uniref:LPS O-antigen chain length determinant protein WzzB n=1 Tax=Pseudomonas entomophila TaxID=312306 RepID=UPI002405691A|nr:Wzz/FepE/Etk N-terminal domain-containing protein [Pseudomonas entomophila]MDF9617290.1 Wzz/FepE/Etk N-terminal domain-containing protein [Pseudomonas entomophila]